MAKQAQTSDHDHNGTAHARPQPKGKLLETAVVAPAPSFLQTTADPRTLTPAHARTLQRTLGNQTLGRLAIQRKMTLGPVGDAYEQEADAVAKQVVNRLHTSPAQSVTAQTTQRQAEEDELQMKPLVQRQEEEEEVQMKPLPAISTLQRQEEEEELQMKPLLQRQEEEELQAKGDPMLAGGDLSGDVETAVSQAKSGGEPLNVNVRQPMENAFNADFSSVKIHTDSQADSLNRSLSARAFTTGQDIFFRSGEYNPGSTAGQELLAHELTHTVQQGAASVQRSRNRDSSKDKLPVQLKPTQRLVTEKTILQRKIGFEFELNHWDTYRAEPAGEIDEITTNPKSYDQYPSKEAYSGALKQSQINRTEKWKPMSKGDILVERGDAEVTADEMGAITDLELRTKALDETNTGQVQTAANLFGTILDEMATEYRNKLIAGHQLRARDLTGTLKIPAAFFRTDRPTDKKGKPQVTTGLRLESLPTLIRNLYPDPNETNPEKVRRGEGRLKGTGFNQDTQQAGPILKTMGAAPGKAENAITTFVAKHKNAPNPASDKLTGLVAMLIAYMDMGKEGLVRSYAKTIAPVMARTDFATMFAMLPDNERDYYSGDNGGKFVDLLKGAGYNWWTMGNSIYSGGIKESQEPNEWYKDLKRRDWLKGMTAPSTGTGSDQLTGVHYPTQRGKDEIEGLGSYGNRTDPVNTLAGVIRVPILELRSLPTMTPAEFSDFAIKLARLVTYLNAGQDKTFGEA